VENKNEKARRKAGFVKRKEEIERRGIGKIFKWLAGVLASLIRWPWHIKYAYMIKDQDEFNMKKLKYFEKNFDETQRGV